MKLVSTEFHSNALHSPGGQHQLFNAQTPEEVAAVIQEVIDHPRAEAYTNPTIQLEQVKRYYSDVEAFEEMMMKR